MAYAPLHLLCLLAFVFPISIVAQGSNPISLGSSLTATDKATPWLSPSGDFAFGFRQVRDKDQFLLSIWFDKIPDKTIVWYGNDGNTVTRGSKVELNADFGLVLRDSQGKQLWKPRNILSEVSYGFMNDTGNFVLVGSDSLKLWDSFSNPTDTLLPTQTMEINGVLYSRLSETNFTSGRFQLRLLPDGNLVLNTRDIRTNNAYAAYYISGTFDQLNASNSGYQVRINERGYMYILRRNGEIVDLTTSGVLPFSGYHRATLNFDGVFVQYYHPKNFTERPTWTPVWTQPDNICVAIGGELGSGACGFNSVCRPDDNKRPICECPKGYSLLDPDNKYGSCKPSFIQNCDFNGTSSAEDLYDFEELIQTDWPTSDFEQLKPISESDCRRYCLEDCFCAVAIYRGDSCWKKKLPLSNGRKDDKSVNGKALIKYMKRNLPPQSPGDCPYCEKKDQDTLIIVESVLLGSSVFVNLLFVGAACFGYFCIYHKKTMKRQPDNNSTFVETNLRCFTYKELAEATNGFKEELGRGAFGIVYKGVIQMGSTTIVAVKKLDGVVQDGFDKEFKTEVNAISQTHHKNLVRLLGFCEDGEHRLLVYEYMSNGTLASFVFGNVKPSWTQRRHVKVDVYSFGVLLLEIICCRRSLEDNLENGEEEQFILTDWVWDCFQEGRLVDLVDHDKEAILNEWDKLERFVMVGIWCIQEGPSLRPNMRQVSIMLEGVVDVPNPPCPSPLSFSST